MSKAKVTHVEEIEAVYGVFKPIGRQLGVTAFGVNIEEFPQHHEAYPEHDHAEDGQEELYYVISGQATLTIEGRQHRLRPGAIAYVPAGTKRRFTTPDSPVQLLAIGATPGKPFSDILAAREQAATT